MAAEIVEVITTAMMGYATGAGTAIVQAFDSVFIQTAEGVESITNFGIYSLVFVGVGMITMIFAAITRKVG